MRISSFVYLLTLVATASCSLLEMSKTLWTKALEGGLTKIGALDPLRIPIVKVDQSEGNTSYRMILRNVEIYGLNSSSLESIHLARGRLKTNLSEHEAGYVSYTDQRDLDMIRYRFHTVAKESAVAESQNLEVKTIPGHERSSGNFPEQGTSNYEAFSSENQNYRVSSPYGETKDRGFNQERTVKHEASSSYENDRSRLHAYRPSHEASNGRQPTTEYHNPVQHSQPLRPQFSNSYSTMKTFSEPRDSRDPPRHKNVPGEVRVVYAERLDHPVGSNDQPINRQHSAERPRGTSGCDGSCDYHRNPYRHSINDDRRKYETRNGHDDIGTAATANFESRRTYASSRYNPARDSRYSMEKSISNERSRSEDRAANFDPRFDRTSDQRKFEHGSSLSQRLEEQPGYVDIVYADGKDQKIKHFGNLRVEPGRDVTVYSLEDVLKDLRDHTRFIIHNFTEGEALTKKNDAVKATSESKRIQDLVRYAKDFQEKNGYYEEGMQLIYHYGGLKEDATGKDNEARRTKRAHLEDETDDDIMHIILRIRVPMLRLDAGYVLTGSVGKQVLRGDGLLSANFTELIGDFTLELKKVDDDTMIVRAARAKLSAAGKNITLQGMDEEGPIGEILTQGLMAAEAVAAMLADDLATKALSEKTADSIIYRMYKNLPPKN